MYTVSQINPTLGYIYNYPKETKRIIGITYKQLIQLIENAPNNRIKKVGDRQNIKKIN
ncbi:MAG: hypothetical protein MK289_23805 [Trichodesmium sp. ALOHA_ZT_67]|nr:hypothetical protein [Trichodesmium sp. ALOHA_ZT_67]